MTFPVHFQAASTLIKVESIAILLFAVVFFVIGLLRHVEFKGNGLSTKKRIVFSVLHVLGCLSFSAALVLGVVNLYEDHRTLMFSTFIGAMVLLAPGQFMIGQHRRRQLEL